MKKTVAASTESSNPSRAHQQCHSCIEWLPVRGKEESGRCNNRRSDKFKALTYYSDSCRAWKSNERH